MVPVDADSLESYKLTACLYTLIDVADLFINCSFRSATGKGVQSCLEVTIYLTSCSVNADRFAWIQQQQRDVVGSKLAGM